MSQISDEDLRLPDVTMEITEGQWLNLPRELDEMINAYGRQHGRGSDGKMRVTVAGYRWKYEIEPAVRRFRERQS